MASRPLQQELLVTLFGLYADSAGVLKVSTVVALMADLGVEERAVRSTVSRLKTKGILQRVDEEGPVRYFLADRVSDSFQAADKRIFAPQRSHLDDPWALVIFSVPEAERKKRYELRTELTGQGFGFVTAGVAIAPWWVMDQAIKRLRTQDLDQYVDYFRVQYENDGELRERVAKWWDLDALDNQYNAFIRDYAEELTRWQEYSEAERSPDGDDHREAFALYIPLLTRWRRFPYRDPNIPLELLPDGWKAPEAKSIFLKLHAVLQPLSDEHAEHLLRSGSGSSSS